MAAAAPAGGEPDEAAGPARQARLYFEKRWWSDGVAAYRLALRQDPALAADPALVNHVIESLQSARFHDKAAAFLRELGEPARPLIEQAGRAHENPIVRTRVTELLEAWNRADRAPDVLNRI
jgi:hypothetical protein